MQHPYPQLEAEYISCLQKMKPSNASTVDKIARHLLGFKDHYVEVSVKTNVPIVWLATTFERESSSDFTKYFGNGDSLMHKTIDVPRGRGPFILHGQPDWTAGTYDALHVDLIDKVSVWTWARLCYEWELWNGFGYRSHGVRTPYVWAMTNLQQHGKYEGDGEWKGNAWDGQMGCAIVARRMVDLDSSLEVPGWPGTVNVVVPEPLPPINSVPTGLDGHEVGGVYWLQASLNRINNAELDLDNNYGRDTRRAVIYFQKHNNLDVDGIAGPATIAAIEDQLEADGDH